MLIGPPISRTVSTAPSGTISPAGVAHLEQLDLVRVVAERALGLHDHLPGAAEPVEVVDVVGAEVDLQRVEDVLGVDAHRLALVAVEVHVQLRHVGPEHGEQVLDLVALAQTVR